MRLQQARGDLNRVTLRRMLSELFEGKLLETRSIEAPSLYLNKSNTWDIFSSHEKCRSWGGNKMSCFIGNESWKQQWEVCYARNLPAFQRPSTLSLTAMRQGPSLQCHVCPQWLITRASQSHPIRLCAHSPGWKPHFLIKVYFPSG